MLTPSSRAISSASVVLPSPGGPKNKRVVEWFFARHRRVDGDPEAVFHLLLPDELREPLRAKRQLDDRLVAQASGVVISARDIAFTRYGQEAEGGEGRSRARRGTPPESDLRVAR